jgi:hypothetical protein
MKKPFKKLYHVFSWQDDSNKTDVFTESWKKALRYYRKLKKEGWNQRRLYCEVYETEEDFEYDNYEERGIFASDLI